MKARLSASAAALAVVGLLAGTALAQQSWVSVGSGSSGAHGTGWWQNIEVHGNSQAVVVDGSGYARQFSCPAGQSITVLQSGGSGTAVTGMSSHVGAGGASTSIVIGGGQGHATTSLGGGSSTIVTGATPGAGQLKIVCR